MSLEVDIIHQLMYNYIKIINQKGMKTMSKIVTLVNWTVPNGMVIEVKIEITKSVEKEISYADGYNIDLGNAIVEFKKISVYINGKYHESTSDNPQIVEDGTFTADYKAKVKAGNGYARLTDNVIINEMRYNSIMMAITAAEVEAEVGEIEYAALKVIEKEKEIANRARELIAIGNYSNQIKNGLCPKCKSYCYGDCKS